MTSGGDATTRAVIILDGLLVGGVQPAPDAGPGRVCDCAARLGAICFVVVAAIAADHLGLHGDHRYRSAGRARAEGEDFMQVSDGRGSSRLDAQVGQCIRHGDVLVFVAVPAF